MIEHIVTITIMAAGALIVLLGIAFIVWKMSEAVKYLDNKVEKFFAISVFVIVEILLLCVSALLVNNLLKLLLKN